MLQSIQEPVSQGNSTQFNGVQIDDHAIQNHSTTVNHNPIVNIYNHGVKTKEWVLHRATTSDVKEDHDSYASSTPRKSIRSLLGTKWGKALSGILIFAVISSIIIIVLNSQGLLTSRSSTSKPANSTPSNSTPSNSTSTNSTTSTHFLSDTMIQAENGDLWNHTECWQDGIDVNGNEHTSSRILNVRTAGVDMEWLNMTNILCADVCAGFRYFMTEYSVQCYCGNTIGQYANLTDQSSCHNPCAGDPKQLCGGFWAGNMYTNLGWV